mmetsp:Transcript_33075/g.56509  ORF Transcript_33075/g.56509 Transcript_33075/m.56509 type:complete len:205 (-) Transcript_33075:640-1254(-)
MECCRLPAASGSRPTSPSLASASRAHPPTAAKAAKGSSASFRLAPRRARCGCTTPNKTSSRSAPACRARRTRRSSFSRPTLSTWRSAGSFCSPVVSTSQRFLSLMTTSLSSSLRSAPSRLAAPSGCARLRWPRVRLGASSTWRTWWHLSRSLGCSSTCSARSTCRSLSRCSLRFRWRWTISRTPSSTPSTSWTREAAGGSPLSR